MSPGRTRLVLVRHGQSVWNAERRIQGQSGTGLSEVGVAQAEHTADWVAASHPEADVVTSDLQRAVETSEPIAARLGVGTAVDDALRERHFGDWQGMTVDELDGVDPDRSLRWRDGVDVIGEVGGESDESFRKRVTSALETVAERGSGRTTVVVTHGGVVWHGLHGVLGLRLGTLGAVGNACVSEVVMTGDGHWYLESWNQTAHLPLELRTTQVRGATNPPVGR